MSADGRPVNPSDSGPTSSSGPSPPAALSVRALGRRRLRQDVRADRAIPGRLGAGRPQAAPPHLSQLVAITFTERAAREMRDRIRECLPRAIARMSRPPGRLLAGTGPRLDSARISTIHAFCAALLRAHAVEAGIDPRFRRARRRPGRHAAVRVDRRGAARPAGRARRGGAGAGDAVRPDRLRGMIARLLAVRAGDRLAAVARRDARGPGGAMGGVLAHDDTCRDILRQIGESAAARTVLDLAMRYPPAHPKMRERCDFLLEQLPKLRVEHRNRRPTWPRCASAAKVQGGGTKKDWVNEQVYDRFRDAAKALRDGDRWGGEPDAVRRGGGPPRRGIGPANCSAWPPTWPANMTGGNGSWACSTSTTC